MRSLLKCQSSSLYFSAPAFMIACLSLAFSISCSAQNCYVPPESDLVIKGDVLRWINFPEDLEGETCLDISQVNVSSIKRVFIDNETSLDFKTIIFPESLTEIGDEAFLFGLDFVNLPESLRRIGGSAFRYGNIEHVDLPKNCAVVQEDAFRLNKITSFTWPTVDLYNFSGFKENKLRSLHIPANVHSIGASAFTENPLESVEFSEGLDTIGWGAFANFKRDCHYTNKYISWDTVAPYTPIKSLTFPKSLKRISARAFYRVRALKTVNFAEGLVSLGDEAFAACDSIGSISFPSTLRSIGNSAFGFCMGLRHVELNDGITNISPLAFSDCQLSGSLLIPGSLTKIGYMAFANAFESGGNVDVIISEGVQTIARQAFVISLVSSEQPITTLNFSFPSTLRNIEANAFWGVWMDETPLPLIAETGDSLRWDAYLDGVLVAENVRTIGGLNRCGYTDFSRRSYVATVIERQTSSKLQRSEPEISVYDLNGRKIYQGSKQAIPPLRGVFVVREKGVFSRLLRL